MYEMEGLKRLKDSLYYSPKTRLMLDWSGMGLTDSYFDEMREKLAGAFEAMDRLEKGAIANPSEERMVGHYWLRNAEMAPDEKVAESIRDNLSHIQSFTKKIHGGELQNESGSRFKNIIVAGMGGSSLGTAFVYHTLPCRSRKMKLYFMDNTDPDGMDNIFDAVAAELDATMILIISKSGKTVETRNCMEEARVFYERHGLCFSKHAVSISERDNLLDAMAAEENWLDRFFLWDWVGGRTSVMSAVGLLPLSLVGVDTMALLQGAAECDQLTRSRSPRNNPAALMALSWYRCSGGRGKETMVVLPYKDSLELFAKHLQQLVMESLGKEHDLSGHVVHQGLTVIGNKGSSDQHSYVQQLVAGEDNYFVTFVEVLRDREGESPVLSDGSTSGAFLQAFLLGTKKALEAQGHRTMTITIPAVTPYYVGALIALFERAVGFYASLINVNAYDQPAVEQGKNAANGLIALRNAARKYLSDKSGQFMTAEEIAETLSARADEVFRLMLHLAVNDPQVIMREEKQLWESTFAFREDNLSYIETREGESPWGTLELYSKNG
jgi:glucose-6-phosphate isomerase